MGRKSSFKRKRTRASFSIVACGRAGGGALVVVAFFLPWLDYVAPTATARLAGLPSSGPVEGWRLPFFIGALDNAWSSVLMGALTGRDLEPEVAWLVYLAPFIGLQALQGALGRDHRGATVVRLLLNGLAGVLLLRRFLAIGEVEPPFGIAVRPAMGLILTILGHAVVATSELAAISRRRLSS